MKIKYLFILITFLFLSGNTVFALPTNDLENNPENAQDPVVYIDKGDMYYSRGGDWLELALKEYLKAKDFISDKADYNYKVAYCYYQLNNLFESQKYFNKA